MAPLRRILLTIFFIVLATAPLAPRVHAAQEAVVSVEQAAIRERPSLDAKILESKPSGEKLRVSSFSKDGWYKTKSNIGQYGWIWQADLTLLTMQSDVRSANLELQEKSHEHRGGAHNQWIFLRVGGMLVPMITGIASKPASFHATLGGFAELSLKVAESTRFAARLLTFVDGSSLKSPLEYDVTPGGTLAMFGIENDLAVTETHDLAVGLYAGPTLTNSVAVVRHDSIFPASFAVSEMAWGFVGEVSYKYIFTRWLRLVGEAGIFYVYTPQIPIPNFGSSHINEFGPMINGALEFAF